MEAWTASSKSMLPTGRKTRALLAIIALAAPRPMLRGKLAEMLWSRRPEEQARASLRQEIHRLLDALHPLGEQVLNITRDHLALRSGAVWVDVDEVLRASSAKPATLGLVDGELLEGLDGIDPAFDNWLVGERERLSDRARTLADAMLRDQTEPVAVITAAQQLLRIDRTHEGAWRAMMRAYVNTGERGMAIQAYERCRAVLADQLDAQPSAETQRLAAEIRSEATPGRPAGNEPVASLPSAMRATARPIATRPAPRPAMRGGADEPAAPRAGTFPAAQSAPGPAPESMAADVFEPGHDVARDSSRSPAPRGGPRVGVLPPQLIGMSDAEAHLSSGFADEIGADLARFRWMFILSSSSLSRFMAEPRDETTIRQALGIDFLLDGKLQRGGDRVRASFRLLDLRGGDQVVWSGKFDHDATDVLNLQDDLAAAVAAQIEPEILLVEAQRIAARAPRMPTPYDRVMRALALIQRMEKTGFLEAGDLLREAIATAPQLAMSHAWSAYWHMVLIAQGWAADRAAAMDEAVTMAERAIRLDHQDARALTIAGHVKAMIQSRPREAMALHERALTLNPNLAIGWVLSGVALMYLGELEEAARRIGRYKQLSPLDPQAFLLDNSRVLLALMQRDVEGAIAIGREVAVMNGGSGTGLRYYLTALGHGGVRQEIDSVRARLLAAQPEFTISGFLALLPLERDADRAYLAEGLRRAGIPE